ncbi:MAG: hypothetical protein M3Q10_17570 [Chloroflexota bacterium]|nr:hypothetical protein [Chloroflexota bacterium]
MITEPDELTNVYADPRRAPWAEDALPRLRALAAEPGGLARLVGASGLKGRALRDVLAGRSTPRADARAALAALLDRTPASPDSLLPEHLDLALPSVRQVR